MRVVQVIAAIIALGTIAICAYIFRLGNSRQRRKSAVRRRVYSASGWCGRRCRKACGRDTHADREAAAPSDGDSGKAAPPGSGGSPAAEDASRYVEAHELTEIGWLVLVIGCVICPGLNLLALCLCRQRKLERRGGGDGTRPLRRR